MRVLIIVIQTFGSASKINVLLMVLRTLDFLSSDFISKKAHCYSMSCLHVYHGMCSMYSIKNIQLFKNIQLSQSQIYQQSPIHSKNILDYFNFLYFICIMIIWIYTSRYNVTFFFHSTQNLLLVILHLLPGVMTQFTGTLWKY